MFRGVTDLLEVLHYLLPPWAVITVLGALVLLFSPLWFSNMRTKQLRGRLRTLARTRDLARRRELIEQAFELAAGKPRRLLALTETALKNGLYDVFDRALVDLEDAGGNPLDVERLKKTMRREGPAPMHPIEVATRVEALLQQGMVRPARELVDASSKRYAGDDDLEAVRALVELAEAGELPIIAPNEPV